MSRRALIETKIIPFSAITNACFCHLFSTTYKDPVILSNQGVICVGNTTHAITLRYSFAVKQNSFFPQLLT